MGLFTRAQLASRILRSLQIPEDSTASSVQALADSKQYIYERMIDIYSRRNWPEYFILGSYSVPASTKRIALSSITADTGFATAERGYGATFALAVATREGANAIMPEDAGIIQKLKADLWAETESPSLLVNRGQSGLFLLGQFSSATTLNFYGKATIQDLTDAETWVMNADRALILGATADMLRDHDRDDNRALIRYQEYEAEIAKLIAVNEEQMANMKRIVPLNPWTRHLSRNGDYSRIGNQSNW